jgi:hypothetical protein
MQDGLVSRLGDRRISFKAREHTQPSSLYVDNSRDSYTIASYISNPLSVWATVTDKVYR